MSVPDPPRTMTHYWCPECGWSSPIAAGSHLIAGLLCPGRPVEIMYAPVLAVRQVVLDAAAKHAGTGHPGDMLISRAMLQALPEIDTAYPPVPLPPTRPSHESENA